MTAAIFPAYFLARTIARRPAALFAAAGAAAIPALAYSPMLIEEPLAYPYGDALPVPDREGARYPAAGVDRRRCGGVDRRAASCAASSRVLPVVFGAGRDLPRLDGRARPTRWRRDVVGLGLDRRDRAR